MIQRVSRRGFTTKRAERQAHVPMRLSAASAGRKTFRGFTLIETLVAVFIVGVSITLFSVVGTLLKNAAEIRFEHTALRVAHTKLDELRALGYAALPPSGIFSDPLLASIPSASASTSVSTYNTKTKKVVVGVAWVASTGSSRYVSLTTLVTEVGGL